MNCKTYVKYNIYKGISGSQTDFHLPVIEDKVQQQ